jgi:hypothetical protein
MDSKELKEWSENLVKKNGFSVLAKNDRKIIIELINKEINLHEIIEKHYEKKNKLMVPPELVNRYGVRCSKDIEESKLYLNVERILIEAMSLCVKRDENGVELNPQLSSRIYAYLKMGGVE